MSEDPEPVNGPRARLRSAAATGPADLDPSRLEDDRERLRAFARQLSTATEPWPLSDAARFEIRQLAAAVEHFLEGTESDLLGGMHRELWSGKQAALDVLSAASGAVGGVQRLNVTVAGVGRSGPGTDRTGRLWNALVIAAQEVHGLGLAVRALADAGPTRAEWTVAARCLADGLTDVLEGVVERAVHADGVGDRPAPYAELPADDAAGLGVVLGRAASRENLQAQGFRAAAVALMLTIAGVAWSVLWRTSLDTAGLVLDLAKLATVVPLALLVSYLQKEAALHRAAAARLGELKLQLLYVDRFFPDGKRDDQRTEIWNRWATGLPPSEVPPTISNDLAAILERIAELVKSLGSLGRGG